MAEITLDDVIRVADRGYPDSLVQLAHQVDQLPSNQGVYSGGDTLALFIARELRDSFDLDDVADNAYHYAADILWHAKRQLEDVIDALRAEGHHVSLVERGMA